VGYYFQFRYWAYVPSHCWVIIRLSLLIDPMYFTFACFLFCFVFWEEGEGGYYSSYFIICLEYNVGTPSFSLLIRMCFENMNNTIGCHGKNCILKYLKFGYYPVGEYHTYFFKLRSNRIIHETDEQ